jgi:peptide/nickel transport system permease protein
MTLPTAATPSPAQPRAGIVTALRAKPLAALSLAVLALVTIAVVLAPLIAPYDPLAQDLYAILQGPSATHPLGTDALGRDVLSRLLHGGQPALGGVATALAIYLVTGVVLGIVAGYLGGLVDRTVSAVVDILMALPSIVIVMAVLAIFNQSLTASMITFGFLAAGNLIRVIRGVCLTVREELYVSAALVSGLGHGRIMFRHVLPAIMGPLVVQASFFGGIALSLQTGLGYLGLGTIPPAPSWGGMVGEAATVMAQSGYLLFITGGIIALMKLAFGLLGDGLRDMNAEKKKGGSTSRPKATRSARAAANARPPVRTTPAPASGAQIPGALLEVRDYTIGFSTNAGAVTVVDSISFTLGKSEILGLVGESGSGKTVTALSLLGLLPPNGRVTAGGAWLDGNSIVNLTEKNYRPIRGRRIGLVSQEPMVALDPLFTIGDQLGEVLRHLGAGPSAGVKARTLELLRSVRLPNPEEVVKKYPHELSGGMIQRVVIAMALAGDPDILIADEPTTALDVTVQAGILDLLRDLRDKHGLAILLVTHDLGVVADLCDRAIVMSKGRIVEAAEIDDLFYAPQHEYTRKLIDSTPSLEKTS